MRKLRKTPEVHDINYAIYRQVKMALENVDIFQNCLNCKFWNGANELCLKYQMRPPAHVIVNACPAYEDSEDALPF